MLNFKSVKIQLNLFLVTFAVFSFFQEPRLSFILSYLCAILFCIVTESVLLYWKTKKIQITPSSVASGLIIGSVLSSDSPWWFSLVVAVVAIGSKRIFCFHGKNLFNPAAIGIFSTVLLFREYTEWKGAYAWYFLIPAGIYFVSKIKKTELVVAYFFMAFALFIPQALLQEIPFLSIFGYLNYFFIFIMLIEPKTTPSKPWPKILFGAGVALLVFLFTETGFRYEPELCSLLIMNMLTPWLEKLPNPKFLTTFKIIREEK